VHTKDEILRKLKEAGTADNATGMKRFGISGSMIYGVKVPVIRRIAEETGKHHGLAAELWETGIHEAMILATMIEEPDRVTEEQLESWVSDIDSWDLCDHFCGNLVIETDFAGEKITQWAHREEEFVKRAGFVLIAETAVRGKKLGDEVYLDYLDIIRKMKGDDRNFVRKAASWALRQIGKRNMWLHGRAIEVAEGLAATQSNPRRWVGKDALRELRKESVARRVEKKSR